MRIIIVFLRKFGTGATLKAERLAEVTDKLFDKEIEVVSIDEGQFVSVVVR